MMSGLCVAAKMWPHLAAQLYSSGHCQSWLRLTFMPASLYCQLMRRLNRLKIFISSMLDRSRERAINPYFIMMRLK